MNSFEWSLPTKIHFGLGEFKKIKKILKGFGRKTLIITSSSYAQNGSRNSVLKQLIEQLNNINVESKIFHEIEPNPRTTTIDAAALTARQFGAKYIIALGGGSVMDAAKCVSLLSVNDGTCIEYAYKGSGKDRKKFNHALPLVCIPTIAATSSETDSYAVVTDPITTRKIVVFGDSLQPSISIIDPELTFTVPAKQTIDGAFDILTHVLETYVSSKEFSPIQDRITESIAKTVIEMLPKALENPQDPISRSNLSWCASLALCGIMNGREGSFPIHALEHGISAYTDVSHGRGLSLLLPHKLAFDSKVIPNKIIQLNNLLFNTKETDPIKALNNGLVEYMKKVGAYTTWKDLPTNLNHELLISKTIEHAMEVDAILEKNNEPYLENIRDIYSNDAKAILNCAFHNQVQEI